MVSEAKYKSIYGERLKILTPKNASEITNSSFKVKAGNTSENLLNEIRKIIYFL